MSCQDHLYRGLHPTQISRRWFFEQCGVGLGAAALGHLMGGSAQASVAEGPLAHGLVRRAEADGFVAGMLASPLAVGLLAIAGALQVAGFFAIRKLGGVST